MEENLAASLKTGTARIRRLVFNVLLHDNHNCTKYDLDEVASQLAIATNASGNEEIKVDVIKLVRSAFTPKGGGGAFEYNIALAEFGITDRRRNFILYVKKERLTRTSPWRMIIGLFVDLDDARRASIDRWRIDGLSYEDKVELVNELVTKSKTTTTNATNQPLEWQSSEALDAALKRNRELENELQIMQAKFESLQTDRDKLNEELLKVSKRPSSASAEKQGHPKRTKDRDPMDIDEDEETSTIQLFYIFKGQAGEVQIGLDNDATITTAALKANIITEHLTSDELVHEGRATTYEVQRINKVDVLVPSGVSAVMNSHLSMWQNKAKKIDKFIKLFSKEKSVLPPEIMRIFTSFSMHNSGGSDQATTELFYASMKMINAYLELGLTNEQIGKGCFCQTTLASSEYELAAHSTLLVAEELKDVKYIAVSQDGGNKKGDEYLAIVITYPVVNEDGSLGFQRICLDCVPCGKKKDEIVEAIDISLRRLYRYTDGKFTFSYVLQMSLFITGKLTLF